MEEQESVADESLNNDALDAIESINAEDQSFPQSDDFVSEPSVLNGNELIDATQNAIVGVAENVSEALTLVENKKDSHEQVSFYADAEFWVGMAFVLTVLMIAKSLWLALRKALQSNIDGVVNQIDDAVRLRDDAQKLLAEYERKCSDIDESVAKISAQAQKTIKSYRDNELKNLQRELQKKQKNVQSRIEHATEETKNEVNALISAKAIEIAQNAIKQNITDDEKKRLIDEAIMGLDKLKEKFL